MLRLSDLFAQLREAEQARDEAQRRVDQTLMLIKLAHGSTFTFRGKTWQIRTANLLKRDRKRHALQHPFMVELKTK